MTITIFDETTGQILRVVDCIESDIALQVEVGNSFLIGHYSDSDYYVNNGVAVAMPPKPSEYHVFDYSTKQWIDPRTPETEWPLVRAKRDRLLLESDWTQLPDVPLATKEAWAEYRQQLRDVTLQQDPFNIVWPTRPT